ncbi:mannose-6-phosphate isomerase/mannose-1-phosphate guanylyl transferase [Lunatimonas lonarensis]|uniref:Mannose-6-phosphate isomerase/mannose-1-phosphate guanylyl transferase n=1 Tax=Lunatimonas lonarensis TaxID=1232681 RepID=R7ZWP0_9BACT|nr:mannose-6-phosphate isomerase/mannose-1-phosphate guanylyl transferase [Lunatimonas lonarensis]EON78551.1 mannose-6-phosphate isomerase/mannose-1-phosphate guanylyl transferase [Lunatimonas lonarensis]
MNIEKELTKEEVFGQVRDFLAARGLGISAEDSERPWGGFFVIEEGQIGLFRSLFFPEVELTDFQLNNKLSPKILLVAPERRLSWQYHFRRAEIWKLIVGEGAIIRSDTDEENEPASMVLGEVVRLRQGERHRLIGLGSWGVVAEIWMHTDPTYPSDEDDIVRVQDDFQRK